MQTILTINSGSSSLKASLFSAEGGRQNFRFTHVRSPAQAFEQLMLALQGVQPDAIGHRLVHGGDIADVARWIDTDERQRLEDMLPLAPLHLPGNLMGVDWCASRFDVPQLACFDTAFHAGMPEWARRFPIPQHFGLRRFGFHGINYAYVASCLPALLGQVAYGKVIVAHLGSGASLCLMQDLQSIDTTMGFTPAGGIVMGTRSGDLDPGVMLELARRCSPEQLNDLVFHQMGLLALSDGISAEMDVLLEDSRPSAAFAVEYFSREVRAAIGAMAARAGGIDALVFTGGIGEHAASIRAAICDPLGLLGFELDAQANYAHQPSIGTVCSKPIAIVPADEESMIHQLVCSHLSQ